MTMLTRCAAPLCAALSLLLSTQSMNAQTTLRVPSQYADIQAALNAATSGDTVLVEPGLHFANDIDPLGKEVTIRGEFGPEQTVIDGQLQGRLFLIQNDEGPGLLIEDLTLRRALVPAGSAGGALRVTGSAAPTVRGCRIERCNGQQGTAIAVLDDASLLVEDTSLTRNRTIGDGMVLVDCSAHVTLRRCMLADNRETAPGGGGLISTPSLATGGGAIGSLVLDDCSIRDNEAIDNMVEVENLNVSLHGCVFEQHVLQSSLVQVDLNRAGNSFEAIDCVFRNNVAGGQLVPRSSFPQNPMIVRGCRFVGNHDGPVRGTLVAVGGELVIEDSTFADNHANAQFGVLHFQENGGSGRIRRCRIVDNWANSSGGIVRLEAVTDVRIESTLIADNVNAGVVSAVLAIGTVDLDHCTILDNACTASLVSGQVAVLATGAGSDLTSSIVRGNTPLQLPAPGTSALTVSHCNVEGGAAGTGNFDADPLFVFDGEGDWHLSSASPCRDAGAAGSVQLDLDGTARSAGAAPDVGCDELPEQPFASTADDFELLVLADERGDPYAPALQPSVGAPLDLTVRSPSGNLVGESFFVLGELRANGASFPLLLPGLHLNLASPGFVIVHDSSSMAQPIGGLGLPSAGFTLRFATPAGLSGWTAWLQAASLTPAANNGALAMTRAVQVVLP